MKFVTAFAMVLAASATSAAAGEVIDLSSVGKGMASNTVYPISDSHVILHTVTEYAAFEPPAGGELTVPGVKGGCFGFVEINAGSVGGEGRCTFSDPDGDTYLSNWTATGMGDDGASVGTWAIIGGTGKYTGASGGGSFRSRTDNQTGKVVNHVQGAMILP